jgi:hypothetical protein
MIDNVGRSDNSMFSSGTGLSYKMMLALFTLPSLREFERLGNDVEGGSL